MPQNIQKILESLSPLERKIVPHLKESIEKIKELTGLDQTSILRALQFLQNKNLVEIKTEKKKVVELGTNGIYYKKNHLPERALLETIASNNHLPFQEGKKLSKLSDNEFKAALGVLKDKALIEIKNGKLSLIASQSEISKKSLEEQLIDSLPLEESKLSPEQLHALSLLKKRKDIIEIEEKSETTFSLTSSGAEIAGMEIKLDLLEEVTPEVIKSWNKTKKFRSYDIQSEVPKISGGRKHFVNQSIEYARQIWLDLGFQEMTGKKVQTSFWNFDSLFTAQDHPVREMHDTFFIKGVEGKLPDKELVKKVKQTHEKGVDNSKGWGYDWEESGAKPVVMRTHTTCLSAQTLATLEPKDLPAKYFTIGKNFRNETVDWSHGFEFYQTEGIVIDENVTFRHLLGYLQQFYKKMGFEKIRFTPGYFPYTEPSVEVNVFHPEKKVWLELGGAGVFRPEITIPLLGKKTPVLAWGQGFDRIIMDYYKIKDLREMYGNDLKQLREIKAWLK